MPTLLVRFDRSPSLKPAASVRAIEVGRRVVVESPRGPELATVRGLLGSGVRLPPSASKGEEQLNVLREATPADQARHAELRELAEDLKWALRGYAGERGIPVKIVALEFTLDEGLVTLTYSAEERLDLRGLIQVVREYTPARVHFMAVGAREQAVIMGAIGNCGRENCSSLFLQDLPPVTIRLARDQQLPLNPDKLSGPCGRLMCCLQFEHPMYRELLRDLPRKGAKACADGGGCGRVTKLHPLSGAVDIATEEGVLERVPVEEITVQSGRGKR